MILLIYYTQKIVNINGICFITCIYISLRGKSPLGYIYRNKHFICKHGSLNLKYLGYTRQGKTWGHMYEIFCSCDNKTWVRQSFVPMAEFLVVVVDSHYWHDDKKYRDISPRTYIMAATICVTHIQLQ